MISYPVYNQKTTYCNYPQLAERRISQTGTKECSKQPPARIAARKSKPQQTAKSSTKHSSGNSAEWRSIGITTIIKAIIITRISNHVCREATIASVGWIHSPATKRRIHPAPLMHSVYSVEPMVMSAKPHIHTTKPPFEHCSAKLQLTTLQCFIEIPKRSNIPKNTLN